MALVKAIKFRHLVSGLNGREGVKFATRLMNQQSDVIIKALFKFFMQSANAETSVDNANAIISEIVRSRKKKPSIDSKVNVKLDNLPQQLIGAAASFLRQRDYINLSKANRSVYLGCNTPNLLQELNLLRVKDYSSINLASYPSVKTLKLKVGKLNKLKFVENGSSVMNQLHSFTLDGENGGNFDIDAFARTGINIKNVRTLRLSRIGSHGSKFDIDRFYKVLDMLPNVECLRLIGLSLNAAIDLQKMSILYPNLTGLGLITRSRVSIQPLIEHYGHHLTYLFIGYLSLDLDLSKIEFASLQELSLMSPSSKCTKDILKTAVNLKSISIYLHHWMSARSASIPSEIKDAMIDCMKYCRSLEYMKLQNGGFHVYQQNQYMSSALEGIEQGLSHRSRLPRF